MQEVRLEKKVTVATLQVKAAHIAEKTALAYGKVAVLKHMLEIENPDVLNASKLDGARGTGNPLLFQ